MSADLETRPSLASDIARLERHIHKNGDRLPDNIVESIERLIEICEPLASLTPEQAQVAGLTTAHEKVYAEREEFRTKAMTFMRERDAAMSVGRRLREREARVRALCLHARDTDVYDTPRLELPLDVLSVLDDEKDGEG